MLAIAQNIECHIGITLPKHLLTHTVTTTK